MGYEFEFDSERKLVTVKPVDFNDFGSSLEAMRRLALHPKFGPEVKILCDFRELTYTPTSDETLLTGRAIASDSLFQNHRIAFVVSAQMHQTIFRIMSIVANVWGARVAEFENMQEAEGWLLSSTDAGRAPPEQKGSFQ